MSVELFRETWNELDKDISDKKYIPIYERDYKFKLFHKIIENAGGYKKANAIEVEHRWVYNDESKRTDIMVGNVAVEIKKINWTGSEAFWDDRRRHIEHDVDKLCDQISTGDASRGCMVVICRNYKESHRKYYQGFKEYCESKESRIDFFLTKVPEITQIFKPTKEKPDISLPELFSEKYIIDKALIKDGNIALYELDEDLYIATRKRKNQTGRVWYTIRLYARKQSAIDCVERWGADVK